MKHHPTDEMLEAFASGSIDPITAIMISAHLNSCRTCHTEVEEVESQFADDLLLQETLAIDNELKYCFEQIVVKPQLIAAHAKCRHAYVNTDVGLKVADEVFYLPKNFNKLIAQITHWRSYGGKIFRADIDLLQKPLAQFVYLKQGALLPKHTHKGIELTLVLHGSFSDEFGHYQTGDFLVRNAADIHSPRTKEQDCLCFTLLTDGMIFTEGFARVLNFLPDRLL